MVAGSRRWAGLWPLALLLAAAGMAACAPAPVTAEVPDAPAGSPAPRDAVMGGVVVRDALPGSASGPVTILWAGDTLLADAAQERLEQNGYQWPFEHLLPLLDADYIIVNQEGPITVLEEKFDPDQRWSYNAQPEAAAALAAVGIDAVGLSNNHAMDRGPVGLADTIRHLDEAGVRAFGAGLNLAQAEAPLLIDTPHGAVGVVGLSLDWGANRTAGPEQAGTVVINEQSIRRGYELARAAGARWVVAYVHWGANYEPVGRREREWAAGFARAGYSLVIGHHPHVQQPIDVMDGMPVVYSLGNFVFGSKGRFDRDYPGYGLIAVSVLGPDGFESLRLRCILTDNYLVQYQPRPCNPAQSEAVLSSLHPGVEVQEGVGVFDW